MTALIERRNVLIGVDQLKVGRNEEVRAGDLAGTVDRDRGGRLIGGAESSENQALDVQDDVGDILDHVRDGRELMLGAIDLDRLDSSALKGRQQNAAQRIAQRVTVAALKRLNGNARRRLVDFIDLNLRPNEFLHVLPPASAAQQDYLE